MTLNRGIWAEVSGAIWFAGFCLTVVWIYTVGPSTRAQIVAAAFGAMFLFRSIWPRRKDPK